MERFMRPGRITAALGIIALGIALTADQVQGTDFTGWVLSLWPLILIGVGLELFVLARGRHHAIDWGAIILLVVIGIITGGVTGDWAGRPWRQILPIQVNIPGLAPWGPASYRAMTAREYAGVHEVELEGGSENVQVVRAVTNQVRVTLVVTGRGRDEAAARQQAEALELVTEADGDRLRVDVRWTQNNPAIQDALLTVEVPDTVDRVITDTGSGALLVEGIQGSVSLNAGSGRATLLNVAGSVSGEVRSGGARLVKVAGPITIDGGSGGVEIDHPGGAVQAEVGSGSLELVTDRVVGDYSLTAGSGSVRLGLPPDAGVRVEAEVGSGSITGPGWLQVRDDRAAGRLGDGAYLVRLKAGSGSIHITER